MKINPAKIKLTRKDVKGKIVFTKFINNSSTLDKKNPYPAGKIPRITDKATTTKPRMAREMITIKKGMNFSQKGGYCRIFFLFSAISLLNQ